MRTVEEMVETEAKRITADRVQMQMVLLCMLQREEMFNLILDLHGHYRRDPKAFVDASVCLAQAIENHVVEHAVQTLHLQNTLALLRADTAGTAH